MPFYNKDLDPNSNLDAVDPELAEFFRGQILAAAIHCPARLHTDPSNLDLGPFDFRHVVDKLRLLYCRYEEDFRIMLLKSNVKAVRVNCVADIEIMDRTQVEVALESKSVLLNESKVPTPVADKIGMSLVVRKVPPTVAWRDTRRLSRIINYKAGILNPPHQAKDTVSLILARKDGKPLHPIHVHALFAYTAEKLKDPSLPKNAYIVA